MKLVSMVSELRQSWIKTFSNTLVRTPERWITAKMGTTLISILEAIDHILSPSIG